MKLRVVLAITCTILLTACGGGGGGGGTAGRMGGDQSPLPNTFVLGDVLIYAQGQRTRLSSSCIGARCTLTYQGQSETIDVRDIDPRSGPNVRITGKHVRNGVQVARARASDQGIHFDTWGTWATHSAAINGQGQTTIEGIPVYFVMPLSLGEGTGTNPVSGHAIWTGAMAGTKVSGSAPGPAVTGDARMQVDLSNVTLDLEFTSIAEISSGGVPGAQSPDIVWRDVPMNRGTFRANGLDGRFYGPNHEEAGGVFERNQIAGGFTLVRQ